MSFVALSQRCQWRPRVFVFPNLSRISDHPSPMNHLRLFGTNQEGEEEAPTDPTTEKTPDPIPNPESPPSENQRAPRGKHRRNPEKIEDIICRMMANRAWTTRLQNSIRCLVPEFDHSLVWNVLHRARNSEHALQFFRWVERAGLFNHDPEIHLKIIEILTRDEKLNHARCILLDMPKKGVQWDEDLFVLLIESYGKAGIVQESVRMFDKVKELGLQRSVKSYDALFKVILRKGWYMMAKRYFNKMISEGIKPTKHTYNIILWGFCLLLRLETVKGFKRT